MNETAEDRVVLVPLDQAKCAIVGCEKRASIENRVEELFSTNRIQFFLCDTHMEEIRR